MDKKEDFKSKANKILFNENKFQKRINSLR